MYLCLRLFYFPVNLHLLTTFFILTFLVYNAISYTIFRKGIRNYKNVLHKYSFDHEGPEKNITTLRWSRADSLCFFFVKEYTYCTNISIYFHAKHSNRPRTRCLSYSLLFYVLQQRTLRNAKWSLLKSFGQNI